MAASDQDTDGSAEPASGSASGGRSGDSPSPANGDKVAELEATIRDLDDRWRRALADFDNLNKRLTREVLRARSEERDRVVAQLLPIVDNLELALAHASGNSAALMEGVLAVRDQAIGVLRQLGFQRGDETGVPFDPARHEAVATEADAELPPGTVVRVVRPGYGNGDHQLRPASVVVATRE